MSLEIRGALLDGASCTITIRGGHIASVIRHGEPSSRGTGPAIGGQTETEHPERPAARVIDARGLHAFPSFHNAHTHVAMVLFRGYGDDMPLMEWLRTRIWPAEARLTEEDVHRGARLGILEMIRGGTTFFNEMYWHRPALVRAAEEMGVRALVGQIIIDLGDAAAVARQVAELERLAIEERTITGGRIRLAAAPHAIYTVKFGDLCRVAELAERYDLLVHTHLSETQDEVDRCLDEHGCRPAMLLERAGLVGPRLIAAHGQFLDDEELALLGAAGAALVTNPAANLKLATGGIFPWTAALRAGVRVCLGTDGAASNNTLSMLEAMKLTALLQKHRDRDAAALPAHEALSMATSTAGDVFRLGTGRLVAGAPADLILVDFSGPATQPLHNADSQLVYAAQDACVHTTICDGRVLMHAGQVEVCDEREVVADAAATVQDLLRRL